MEGSGIMSIDYSISAIPTIYKGRQYRSRLEARWAAFFDEIGWTAEYEPFDLGKWSPDFLLTDLQTLVEVKPIREFDQPTWDKASAACRDRGLFDQEQEFPMHGLLLTCVAPVLRSHMVQIGWISGNGNSRFTAVEAYLVWIPDFESPKFIPSIASIQDEGWFSVCGDASRWASQIDRQPSFYHRYATELWARATNAVQWKGPAS